LYALDELPKVPDLPGPKFVFAHILLPHKPFVFGPDGQFLELASPYSLNEDTATSNEVRYEVGYRWQVEYLNKRVAPVLQHIIANSAVPPIIIVQGDHGPTEKHSSRQARLTILNAYFLPGGGEKALYPSITPVNTFRVIFDTYFGSQLGLLNDASYYYDLYNATYELIPNESADCQKAE
jgi:hypothetical protein